jgi:hypothetical protein
MLGGQTFPGIDAFSQERTPTLAVFICNQQTQPASPVVYTNRQKHLFRCNHKKFSFSAPCLAAKTVSYIQVWARSTLKKRPRDCDARQWKAFEFSVRDEKNRSKHHSFGDTYNHDPDAHQQNALRTLYRKRVNESRLGYMEGNR